MSLTHPLRASLGLGVTALVAASLCAAAPAIAAPSGTPSSGTVAPAASASVAPSPTAEGGEEISAAEDVALSVAVSAPEDREAYQAGEIANYVVTATNNGTETIPSLTLTGDPSALAGKVRYKNKGELVARSKTVANVEPGESITLKFSLVILMNDDVPPGTVLTVPFSAQAHDADGAPLGAAALNRSQIIVDPRGAAVKARFSAGDAKEVQPGGLVTYTATVANGGDTTTGGLSLAGDFSDVFDDATLVPGSVTYAGGVGSKYGAPSDVPDTVLWVGKLGYAVPAARALAAGDPGSDVLTVSFTVKVKEQAPVGATLGASISLEGDEVTDETCAAGACEAVGPVVAAAPVEPTPEPTVTPTPTPTESGKPTGEPTESTPAPSGTDGTDEPTDTPDPTEPTESAQPTMSGGTDAPSEEPGGEPAVSSDGPGAGEGGQGGDGADDGDDLAATGASAAIPLGAAGLLAVGGAVLLGASRRRRHG